nr:MAG TPA: hypothetical protein [Caudoviricetes sp.]
MSVIIFITIVLVFNVLALHYLARNLSCGKSSSIS